MGEVWLAEQDRPVRRRVALKLIKTGMDTASVLARFDAERQALAMMSHPCIARVYDAGSTDQGRPFFVMEHVDGEPITDYCDRHLLTMQERLAVFIRVCEGVQHAHQKGVIHRDLKPSNVLVREEDGQPAPKIIDFGLAKAFDQRLTERPLYTELGAVVGTPEYMSPEQAETTGSDVDTRTDVYSLGVLLYVLLVGALPFDAAHLRGEGIDGIRRTIRDQEPSKPSTRIRALGSAEAAKRRRTDPETLLSQLRGDLDVIVMKAIEKDRARRYDSASELAADIQRHLDHRPVLAAPPSFTYLAKKFVRRHRAGVAASALVLVVMLAATVVSSVLYLRAEAARREAEFRAYTASLSAAAAALDLNDAGTVRRHLASASEALRGWECNWLESESDRSLATTLELPAARNGYCMGLSPDGKLVAVRVGGGGVASVRVYDARDGKQLHDFPTWESFAMRFRFSPDRRWLAYSATSPPSVQVWDLVRGEPLFSPDSIKMFSSFLDCDAQGQHAALLVPGQVVIVRLSDWGEVRRLTMPDTTLIALGVFSEDGRWLAVAPEAPQSIRVFDVGTGSLLRELRGTGPVTALRFSPDGSSLGVLGASQLRILDTQTWELRTSIEKIGSAGLLLGGDAAFLDLMGSVAVVGSGRDGVLRACRLDSPEPRGEMRGESSPAISIAWDKEQGRIVTAHARGVVRQWPAFPDWSFARPSSARMVGFGPQKGLLWVGNTSRLENAQIAAFFDLDALRPVGGLQQYPVTLGHGASPTDWAASPDGSQIALVTASGWEQGRLKVFDLASGLTVFAPEPFWGHDPQCVGWLPDGKHLVVAGNDGFVRIFDDESGAFIDLRGHRGAVEDIAIAGDGSRLWTAGADGTLRTWDPASGQALEVDMAPDSTGITCLALFEDRRSLVCGLTTGGIVPWDLRTRRFGEVLTAHSDRVEEIVRTPDGTRVVTGASDGSLVFWDLNSWRELLTRRVDGGLNGMAFSPDGDRLAFGRRAIRVLDVRPEERRASERETHREARQAATAWMDEIEREGLAPAEAMRRIESNTAQGEPVKDAAVLEVLERRQKTFDSATARGPEIARPHVRRQILRDLCITPANDRFWLDLSVAANEIRARADLSDIERDVAAEFALAMRYEMHAYVELQGDGVWTNVLIREMLQEPEAARGDWALALFAAEELVFAVPSSAEYKATWALAQRRTGWPGSRDSLSALRTELGVGDPTGPYEIQSLATRQWERGNLADAERLYKKTLHARLHLSGRYDRSVPVGMAMLAEILHATSRDADAEKLFREAFNLVKEIRGEEHVDVALRGVDLGRFLLETGRGPEAEEILRDAVDRARRVQSEGHPNVATAIVALAEALCAKGVHSEAEPLAREALTIRQRALSADDWRVGEAMSVLGDSIRGQGRFAEAEPLLLKGYEKLDVRGRWESRRTAARERIITLYEAWGKPREAALRLPE
jgi:WD40 repeat protein